MKILNYDVKEDLYKKYVALRATLDSLDLDLQSSKPLYLRLTAKIINVHRDICFSAGVRYAEEGKFFDALQNEVKKSIRNRDVDYDLVNFSDIYSQGDTIDKLSYAKELFDDMRAKASELAKLSIQFNRELEEKLGFEIPDKVEGHITDWSNVLLYGTEYGEFEDFINDVMETVRKEKAIK